MNIFTITQFRYPKQIEDTFKNYIFYYEHETTYKSFFEENSSDVTYEEFIGIKNKVVKKICFAFYVLYFKGGFYNDLNIIPTNNLDNFKSASSIFLKYK